MTFTVVTATVEELVKGLCVWMYVRAWCVCVCVCVCILLTFTMEQSLQALSPLMSLGTDSSDMLISSQTKIYAVEHLEH